MAKGDTTDNVARQVAVMPPWFPDTANAPVLTALLTGAGDAFAFVFQYFAFAALQTRISTATGGWLDLIGWDFFSSRFVRRFGEADGSWQPRMIAEILRPRQTKVAITRMLVELTGKTPVVQEAFNTGDFGSYGTGTMGYGAGLGYGSLKYPNQVFVQAFRSNSNGVPLVSGYGGFGGGYGVGWFSYIDTSQITGPITDLEIAARVTQTIAAGITAWLDIENNPVVISPPPPPRSLDFRFPVPDSEYIPVVL